MAEILEQRRLWARSLPPGNDRDQWLLFIARYYAYDEGQAHLRWVAEKKNASLAYPDG